MTAGIHGVITDGSRDRVACLIIGSDVPRIHHSDGIPVYHVIEHKEGFPIRCKDGTERQLLAYPSHYPAPGCWNSNDWIYAEHENLPWSALIPIFGGQEDNERAGI